MSLLPPRLKTKVYDLTSCPGLLYSATVGEYTAKVSLNHVWLHAIFLGIPPMNVTPCCAHRFAGLITCSVIALLYTAVPVPAYGQLTVFDQFVDLTTNTLVDAQQSDNTYLFPGSRHIADDFIFPVATNVSQAKFRVSYFDEPPNLPNGNLQLRFYDNAGGVPGNLLYGPFSFTATTVLTDTSFTMGAPFVGTIIYEANLQLPILNFGAGTYWISVVGDSTTNGNLGWDASATPGNWAGSGDGGATWGTNSGGRPSTMQFQLLIPEPTGLVSSLIALAMLFPFSRRR